MNTNKMMNTFFLIIYLMIILSFVNTVSVSDMTNSIKNLSANYLKKVTNNNILTIQNEDKMNDIFLDKNQKQFDNSQCSMISEASVCINNGERVILPSATQSNLVGFWSFDDAKPLDDSGRKNHALNKVNAGPSFGGFGYSGHFSEGNFLEVPHSKDFEALDFSFTFWFYLIHEEKDENLTLKACPIIQKGKDDLFNKNYNRYPGIYFDRKEKNFKIYIKTNSDNMNIGETLNSNSKAIHERWLHVALIKRDSKVFLYINGILDSKLDLKGIGTNNKESLFIGGAPEYKEQCKLPFLIDELRYYNNAIEEDYIQAEASPVLGGIEPNFLQLGCFNCQLKDASTSCIDGYKICSSIELHTGGYQIARVMGWIDHKTHVWTSSALKNTKEFENVKGLALCCSEIK